MKTPEKSESDLRQEMTCRKSSRSIGFHWIFLKNMWFKYLKTFHVVYHKTSDSMQQGRWLSSMGATTNIQFADWTTVFQSQPFFDAVVMITVFTWTQNQFSSFWKIFHTDCTDWIVDINFATSKFRIFGCIITALYNLAVS